MHTEQEIATLISQAVFDQNVYVRFEPEVLDFTDADQNPYMILCTPTQEIQLGLKEHLHYVLSCLQILVFGKPIKLLCWNLKNFLSYVRFRTNKPYPVAASVIDLKILESYMGKPAQAPKSLREAMNRLRNLVKNSDWAEVQSIYKAVHLPLITNVIPALETIGILDTAEGIRRYAYYEIDGQINGRLLCKNAYQRGYVPHTLSPQQRDIFAPKALDELFMYFDFQHMEVSVLSWLTQDVRLQEMISKGQDVFPMLFEAVVGRSYQGKEDRNRIKKIFLPCIYGAGANTLAEKLAVPTPTGEKIISRIEDLFPTALAWIKERQAKAKIDGFAKDIYHKCRHFENEYLVRNFLIQAPSALICLHKLIQLHDALQGLAPLAFHVHDGYVVMAHKSNWKQVFRLGMDVLTAPSDLCPGLCLQVNCKAGRNLNALSLLNKKVVVS